MKTTLEIQNLKCSGCEATILKKLKLHEGIQNILINVDHSTVSFDYDDMSALRKVEQALTKLGYPLVGDENSLGRKAKSYLSCAVGRMSG